MKCFISRLDLQIEEYLAYLGGQITGYLLICHYVMYNEQLCKKRQSWLIPTQKKDGGGRGYLDPRLVFNKFDARTNKIELI